VTQESYISLQFSEVLHKLQFGEVLHKAYGVNITQLKRYLIIVEKCYIIAIFDRIDSVSHRSDVQNIALKALLYKHFYDFIFS
jgi:hypothetical protein